MRSGFEGIGNEIGVSCQKADRSMIAESGGNGGLTNIRGDQRSLQESTIVPRI